MPALDLAVLEHGLDRLGDIEALSAIMLDVRGVLGPGRIKQLQERAHGQTADPGAGRGMAVDLGEPAGLGMDGFQELDAERRERQTAALRQMGDGLGFLAKEEHIGRVVDHGLADRGCIEITDRLGDGDGGAIVFPKRR